MIARAAPGRGAGRAGRGAATALALLALVGLATTSDARDGAPESGPARPAAEPAARPAEAGRPRAERAQPVTVDADRMERFGRESLVVFTGNVVARHDNSVQYADRMEVYLDERGERVLRTVSTGNVRIVTRDCKTGTARRVEYFDLEQRMVLTGNARVWQDDNVVTGETITIYLAQDRSVVEGGKQERVKAVFYPRDQNGGPARGAATRPTCVN